MAVHYHRSPEYVQCEVVVRGNALLANVKAFDSANPATRLISLGVLKPDNVIRLEIILEQGDWVTVQLGRVQWVDQDTVAVAILQMDVDDKRKLDWAAWSCVNGDVRPFRWLRKQFWRDELHTIHIAFDPLASVQAVRLLEAA